MEEDTGIQDFSRIETAIFNAMGQLHEIEKLVKAGGKKNEKVAPFLLVSTPFSVC